MSRVWDAPADPSLAADIQRRPERPLLPRGKRSSATFAIEFDAQRRSAATAFPWRVGCSSSSISAAGGRTGQRANTAPLPRSRSVTPRSARGPERASGQAHPRRPLPREAAARWSICLSRAHRSVAWNAALTSSPLLSADAGAGRAGIARRCTTRVVQPSCLGVTAAQSSFHAKGAPAVAAGGANEDPRADRVCGCVRSGHPRSFWCSSNLLGGLQLWCRAERAVRARQRRRNARVAPTRSGGSCRVVHDWPAPPYEETLAQITQAKAVKPVVPWLKAGQTTLWPRRRVRSPRFAAGRSGAPMPSRRRAPSCR